MPSKRKPNPAPKPSMSFPLSLHLTDASMQPRYLAGDTIFFAKVMEHPLRFVDGRDYYLKHQSGSVLFARVYALPEAPGAILAVALNPEFAGESIEVETAHLIIAAEATAVMLSTAKPVTNFDLNCGISQSSTPLDRARAALARQPR